MSRREFLSAAAVSAAAVAADAPDLTGAVAPAVAAPAATGEPYELAGNRIVFTNWFYVRPGGFGWFNARGENVTVRGDEAPEEAHFRRFDYPHGIRIMAQPAERVGPILEPEKEWEKNGKGISLLTLHAHEGRYRLWGVCAAGPCYFESEDGIRWERPELGLVEFQGSRKNNLIDANPGAVFRDPSAPEAERYKGVILDTISREAFEAYRKQRPDGWEPRAERKDVGHVYAIRGLVSPDGLRWTTLPEPLSVEHSDTQLVAYYDRRLFRYVLYTRNYMIGARSPRAPGENTVWWGGDAGGVGRRSIGRSESADFRRFPLSEVILEPGPEMLPNDLLYTNCRTSIPGAPDQHLMFPAIWHASDDTTSIALASSHNGKIWHYLPGSPVFETAPFGQWDGGAIFTHPDQVELPDGRFVLPYTGYNVPHKYPRGRFRFAPGLAVWHKGRLAALEAPVRGEFATVAFYPPGRKLRINVLTQRAGSLMVEVADMQGKPLPGRTFADVKPLVGDHYRRTVVWNGQEDIGHPEGAAILLRFRMEKAKLFGLEFVW